MKYLTKLFLKKFTIQTRLWFMLIIPGMAYFFVSAYDSYEDRNTINQARVEQLKSIVESAIGKTASQLVMRGKKDELTDVLYSLVDATDVSSVAVYDEEMNVFAKAGDFIKTKGTLSYSSSLTFKPITDPSEFDLDVMPVKPQTKKIGDLVFYVDHDNLLDYSIGEFFRDLFQFTIVIICCIPRQLILYKSFTFPLSEIMNRIDNFQHGEMDKLQKKFPSNDEFEQVALALEFAANKLNNQKIEISSKNDALNKEVQVAISAREEADKANKQKDGFVSNVGHELNTPLGGIVSGIDLTESHVTAALMIAVNPILGLNSDQFQAIQPLRSALKSALSSIDVVKVCNSQMNEQVTNITESVITRDIVLMPVTFLIEESMTNILKERKAKAEQKGLNYEYSISFADGTVSRTASGDYLRIAQLMNCLIDNAIRFTEAGFIKTDITVYQCNGIINIAVKVCDSGVGISDTNKNNIFDLFHIGEDHKDKQFSGLGTGLSIASNIIQKMDGKLELLSTKLGSGSTFAMNLELPVANHGEIISGELTNSITKKLLYVDDSATSRITLERYTELENFEVILAKDGYEALQHFSAHNFDALVVDCHMHKMNGFDFTRKIREIEKADGLSRIPIMALTADPSDSNKQQCINAGFDRFYTKPYKRQVVKSILLSIDDINNSTVEKASPEI